MLLLGLLRHSSRCVTPLSHLGSVRRTKGRSHAQLILAGQLLGLSRVSYWLCRVAETILHSWTTAEHLVRAGSRLLGDIRADARLPRYVAKLTFCVLIRKLQ